MVTVKISFQGSDDDKLFVSISNPDVLPAGLHHQLTRYGLSGPSSHKPRLSGYSNGTRKALTELIQTYGCTLEIVPSHDGLAGVGLG
jgi:hypothetical protein